MGYALHAAELLPEVGGLGVLQHTVNAWLLPLLICGFLLIGVAGRVRVYESLVEGGKEGLGVAVRGLWRALVRVRDLYHNVRSRRGLQDVWRQL